jgi:hypothetical protein
MDARMQRQQLAPSREQRALSVANYDPQPAPPVVTSLVEKQLVAARMSSDDHQTKYRVERHAGGSETWRRTVPKLSKAEKKALKRSRHR